MLPPTVTNRALDELVAYRYIKQRQNNICKQCREEHKRKVKRCAVCGQLYDEEHGRLEEGGEAAEVLEMWKGQLEAEENEE